MKWKGPLHGGITQSIINRFLGEDPYRMYLYYGLGLQEYTTTEPNLIYGSAAHIGLEHIIAKPYTIPNFTPEDWEEVYEAVGHCLTEDFPQAEPSFYHSIKRLLALYDDTFKEKYGRFATEVEFQVPYCTRAGNAVTLRGKIDALQIVEGDVRPECRFGEQELSQLPTGYVPGNVFGEHKFKGQFDPHNIRKEIQVDLQTNLYAYVAGTDVVIYDEIKIPDTQTFGPKRRKNQTLRNFVEDIYETRQGENYPINSKRHLWLCQVTEPLEYKEEVRQHTIDPVIDMICDWYNYCSDPDFDFQNPDHYCRDFYKKPIRLFDAARTMTFKPNYHGHSTKQLDLDDLVPVEGYYQELKTEEI